MIKITAKVKGEKTDIQLNFEGTGEDIAIEAVHIMEQIPKQLKETDTSLFLRFLAEMEASEIFGIAVGPKKGAERIDQKKKKPRKARAK